MIAGLVLLSWQFPPSTNGEVQITSNVQITKRRWKHDSATFAHVISVQHGIMRSLVATFVSKDSFGMVGIIDILLLPHSIHRPLDIQEIWAIVTGSIEFIHTSFTAKNDSVWHVWYWPLPQDCVHTGTCWDSRNLWHPAALLPSGTNQCQEKANNKSFIPRQQ